MSSGNFVRVPPSTPRAPEPHRGRTAVERTMLERLQGCGKIMLRFVDSSQRTVELIDFDAYSLLVRDDDGEAIIFKHAVAELRALQSPKKAKRAAE